MSENDERVIRRIIVLVNDTSDSNAALEAAARMAARRGAELQALFVEDVNLLRSAGLPFAREIGLTSATARPLDSREIERRLQTQAEHARQLLQRLSDRLSVRSSFRVSRGDVEREALGNTTPEDLLVVARTGGSRRGGSRLSDREGRIAQGATCSVMFVGERTLEEHQAVVVLYANTEHGRRSLALAAAMARDVGQPLVLLLPPGTVERHETLMNSAREWAHAHGVSLRFHGLANEDAASLLAALRREKGQVLVMQRDSPAMRSPLGRFLLDDVDTPVVVMP